jgi:two-component system LytT family response regulator
MFMGSTPTYPDRPDVCFSEPASASGRQRLTTFVVDDEELARRQIANLVAQVPWAKHIGEAPDGATALPLLDSLRPDVLLLDIHMPEMSGLDLATRLTYAPAVIFTTAHERYAVTAFELEAVDYVLKPFGRRRFLAALERARRTCESRRRELSTSGNVVIEDDSMPAASADGGEPAATDRVGLVGERLLIRDRGAIIPIPLAQVERLQAEDDYVAIFARGRRHLITAHIGDFAAQLPSGRFLRIHRSHIVNLDFVERMVPFDAKRLQVQLRDGTRLLASRSSSEMIRRRAY